MDRKSWMNCKDTSTDCISTTQVQGNERKLLNSNIGIFSKSSVKKNLLVEKIELLHLFKNESDYSYSNNQKSLYCILPCIFIEKIKYVCFTRKCSSGIRLFVWKGYNLRIPETSNKSTLY